MADVRSLLRQQRAARRIDHPNAAYTDSGKLLCTLCRENVKAEGLWEGHLAGEGHRKRAAAQRQQQQQQQQQGPHADDGDDGDGKPQEQAAAQTHPPSQKRKLDAALADDGDDDGDMVMDDAVRRKRSRPDISALGSISEDGHDLATAVTPVGRKGSSGSSGGAKDANLTPPTLARRLSTTPSQGVELQIPSRPATPSRRDGSGSISTPGSNGGLSSVAASQPAATGTSLPSRRASGLAATLDFSTAAATTDADRPSSTAPQVDESEWAAFEADIAAAEEQQPPASASYSADAVISAPAMTAEESAAAAAAAAAAAEGEGEGSRRTKADRDIEDEREEATRAMEDEFEEMQELEQRVRRLKERRDALLRKRSESQGQEAAVAAAAATASVSKGKSGKENLQGSAVVEDDEDEEEEDDEDDDWDGFRFRTS